MCKLDIDKLIEEGEKNGRAKRRASIAKLKKDIGSKIKIAVSNGIDYITLDLSEYKLAKEEMFIRSNWFHYRNGEHSNYATVYFRNGDEARQKRIDDRNFATFICLAGVACFFLVSYAIINN